MRGILFWTVLVGTVVILLAEAWDSREKPKVSTILISYLTLHLLTLSTLLEALEAAAW